MDYCRELRREIAEVEKELEQAKKNKDKDAEGYLRQVLSELNMQYEEDCSTNIFRMY